MKGFNILFILMFLILCSMINTSYPHNKNVKKTILTNCVVIDCCGTPPQEDMTVVITGNTITEMKQGMYRPASEEQNVRVFDLKGAYILPGLWNMHAHLSDLLPDVNDMLGSEAPLPAAILSLLPYKNTSKTFSPQAEDSSSREWQAHCIPLFMISRASGTSKSLALCPKEE